MPLGQQNLKRLSTSIDQVKLRISPKENSIEISFINAIITTGNHIQIETVESIYPEPGSVMMSPCYAYN